MQLRQYIATIGFRWWAMRHVPLLFVLRPWLKVYSPEQITVQFPLGILQKNHLNSMYIAVMVAGADVAAGVLVDAICRDQGSKAIGLAFKELQCKFLRRATSATKFTCQDAKRVKLAYKKAVKTGERQNQKVKVTATNLEKGEEICCAEFEIVVSFRATTS